MTAACTGRGEPEDRSFSTGSADPVQVQFDAQPQAEGLQMRQYEAEGTAPPAGEALRQARGEPLSDEAVHTLLERVPALTGDHGDRQTIALSDGSPPPPLSGSDVQQAFPPPAGSDAPPVATGPLEVLRFAPEREVPRPPTCR